MRVKEKLDYYQLPTTFPAEATPLLHKLINLIDNGSAPSKSLQPTVQDSETVSAALKHEMAGLLRDNNRLHVDIMNARE